VSKEKDSVKEVWEAPAIHGKEEGRDRSLREAKGGVSYSESHLRDMPWEIESDPPQARTYWMEALCRGVFSGDMPGVSHESTREREMGSYHWVHSSRLRQEA